MPVHFTLWPQGASPSPWTHIPSPDLSHTYGPLCWESPGPPRTTSFCPLASLLLAKDLFILQDLVQISSLEIFLFSIIALKLLYSHLSVYLTLSCLLPPPGWISCFKAGQTQYLGLYTAPKLLLRSLGTCLLLSQWLALSPKFSLESWAADIVVTLPGGLLLGSSQASIPWGNCFWPTPSLG